VLKRLIPVEFNRSTKSGKTSPAFITCGLDDETTVEVVAKFSQGCERGVTSLSMEVVATCLAGDLNLPVPEPYLIDVPRDWIDLIPDGAQRARMQASNAIAFGSKVLSGGYTEWTAGTRITDAMVGTAASIMLFDGAIQNPDRRIKNPNCLVRGNEIRIYDHELTFSHGVVLHWKPPWEMGGLNPLETPGFHIFREGLRGRDVDFDPIRAVWMNLSDARLEQYKQAIPYEWNEALPEVEKAIELIAGIRDNIDGCITELKRVLT
jgi:hypothetical protein